MSRARIDVLNWFAGDNFGKAKRQSDYVRTKEGRQVPVAEDRTLRQDDTHTRTRRRRTDGHREDG